MAYFLIAQHSCHIHKFAISDFKPSNLVIDTNFNPKIIDLGDILYLGKDITDMNKDIKQNKSLTKKDRLFILQEVNPDMQFGKIESSIELVVV